MIIDKDSWVCARADDTTDVDAGRPIDMTARSAGIWVITANRHIICRAKSQT